MPRLRDFRIGIISDTHGLLRPEAVEALRGSDLILHAGDIGAAEIIPALENLAPVVAIRGNIDSRLSWAKRYPDTEVAEVKEQHLYVLHNLGELDLDPQASKFSAVIFGHSHKPEFYWKNEVLYFNPGSAGPRRFSLPISVGRITIHKGELVPELIELHIKK